MPALAHVRLCDLGTIEIQSFALNKMALGLDAVAALDRLGRSTRHLLNTLQEFEDLGAAFISFREGFDTSTAAGNLLTTVVAAIGEFERALIVERVKAGLRAAKAKGRTLGPRGAMWTLTWRRCYEPRGAGARKSPQSWGFASEPFSGLCQRIPNAESGGSRHPRRVAEYYRGKLLRAAKKAKVEDAHPHRRRDSLAVRLLEKGAPLETVSILLGHTNVRTTQKSYAPCVSSLQKNLEAAVRKTWA
ncbi:MAG: recombinase family protein [Terriglobia bacterium]